MVLSLIAVLCGLLVASQAIRHPHPSTTPFPRVNLAGRIQDFEARMEQLTRQLMNQQLYMEEKIRSDGQSGLKQIRLYHGGSRPYYSESHSQGPVAACHNHPQYDRTVGMGELNMVINGIDFRTRHNDYKLVMPSRTSSAYHHTEEFPFPEVPPEVTSKATLVEQIAELREWFRAWKDQDHTVRDYRKYFRPVICYMEAGWTTNSKTISEPFKSDRHAIDAKNWQELQEKIRFTSYTGSKSLLENYAYLPTTITDIKNGTPIFAQWNYRILCHPIKGDVPLKYLHLVDDLGPRVSHGMDMHRLYYDRAARFELARDAGPETVGALDEIMSQIPGKNNYPANLHDDVFNEPLYDANEANLTRLNTGYYHRWYKVGQHGAGAKLLHRGFSDPNLWVAQTTQPQIVPMSVNHCTEDPKTQQKNCKTWTKRYTYAVPLEIIYMTPLYKWNPFNLEFKAKNMGRYVLNAVRNGGKTADSALNGTYYKAFYHTPTEFFSGKEVGKDPADTTRPGVGVLDRNGTVKIAGVSGTRIVLPNIPGVGTLRTRFPIVPIHGEGSGVWKELDALKDMLMDMKHYKNLFENPPTLTASNGNGTSTFKDKPLHLVTGMATRNPPGPHTHDVYLAPDTVERLNHGEIVRAYTSEAFGHSHSIGIQHRFGHYMIHDCDGESHCWDGHASTLIQN